MSEFLTKYKARYLALDPTLRIVIACSILVTMCAVLFDFGRNRSGDSAERAASSSESSLSTFIPDGFSLVPIEILNSNGMDSILGRYGTADLFKEGHKNPFMRNVRLVRGIEEDGPWAALVPSDFATILLEAGGKFFVAVKGQSSESTQVEARAITPRRTIIYEGD